MNRQQKEVFVQELKDGFHQSDGLFLVGYKGLRVAQATNLRKQLREVGGAFQVAKITLIKQAVNNDDFLLKTFEPLLKDQIALVFSNQGSSAVAKVLHEFAKKNKQLSVIAGCVDKTFLTSQDFAAFVSLPPREVLLAQVCGTMNAPVVKFVVILKMLITRLAIVLKQIEQQKASQVG